MSKSSSQRQQAQQNDMFSLLPYAYHEASHAIVGHVIGRLIALVSVKHAASYQGCCRFDSYAESTHHHDQWLKERQNPELPTTHWNAVKTLAGALLALQWLTGAEAYTIIGEALGEEQGDWRWDVLQANPINQRRTALAVQREQFVAD